jgi:hypothetical protein
VPGRRKRDDGCVECGGAAHHFEHLPRAYAYVLGLYLGDGCISSHPRGVYRLRITLDAVYPRIIDEAAAAIEQVVPSSRVGRFARRYHDVEVSSRYGFSNVSADIRGIFCRACDALDLHWTTSGRTVYVSRNADVARMDTFIGPKA